uniref:UspA domain-containing protein n=1 Tax=Triticum urartu TaxID=4572 RepID=A0A8R7PAJ3_TRIUA
MMAETKAVASAAAPAEEGRSKTVVLVAVDDSDHSYRALEWAVRHVAATAGVPGARAVELVVVHAKPSPSPVVTMGGPGVSGDVVRLVEADLRKKADGVVDRARRLCVANSVTSATNNNSARRSSHCPMDRHTDDHTLDICNLLLLVRNRRCRAWWRWSTGSRGTSCATPSRSTTPICSSSAVTATAPSRGHCSGA